MKKTGVQHIDITLKSPLKAGQKVYVELIERKGSWLADIHQQHDGKDLWSGAGFGFTGLPRSLSRGMHVDPLTIDEREWFESEDSGLGLKKNDMSVLKPGNFWSTFRTRIDKDGMELDLGRVMDYLRYKFLLVQPQVAPSREEAYDKADYKFVIVEEQEDSKRRVKESDKKARAYKIFGRMEGSPTKMISFLEMYTGNRVPENSTMEWLIAQIDEKIEENIEKFLTIMEDENFEMKSFIHRCLNKGLVEKVGKGKYIIFGETEDQYSYKELIELLKDVSNQEIYLKLKAKLEG